MAFYVSNNLKSGGCAVGEPIVASYQPRSAANVVDPDIRKREFFLAFFTDDRTELGRFNAKIESDLTGDFASWALPGSVSNSLYEAGHLTFRAGIYEDLQGGSVDEIAQFIFTITVAAAWKVTNDNPDADFARYTIRITRSNDALDAFSAPRFSVTPHPYGASAIPTPITPAPAFATAPSISGTATVGQTLSGSDGVITNGSVSARQWLRNGSAISGATASSYKLVSADNGASITFRVTASGAGGTTSATSSARTVTTAATPTGVLFNRVDINFAMSAVTWGSGSTPSPTMTVVLSGAQSTNEGNPSTSTMNVTLSGAQSVAEGN